MDAGNNELSSWNRTATRRAIVEFVQAVTTGGGTRYVPPEERVAVFDNDGTLWCEKPMPVELGFILQRLASMAEKDESLRTRQPWKAAHEKDYDWLGEAVQKHYRGDDRDVEVLIGGLLEAFKGMTVEDYESAASSFLLNGRHPTLHRSFLDCGYQPMIELLRYLEANGFTTYVASAGDRDFMRTVSQEMYGVPPDRVVGTSSALRYEEGENGGSVVYGAEMEVFDDGPAKPVRIWSRVGRRPILAAGNANGDIPMLQFTGGPSKPGLRLLVSHDDEEREFAYTSGAEKALDRARKGGWTVISIKDDWVTVLGDS